MAPWEIRNKHNIYDAIIAPLIADGISYISSSTCRQMILTEESWDLLQTQCKDCPSLLMSLDCKAVRQSKPLKYRHPLSVKFLVLDGIAYGFNEKWLIGKPWSEVSVNNRQHAMDHVMSWTCFLNGNGIQFLLWRLDMYF